MAKEYEKLNQIKQKQTQKEESYKPVFLRLNQPQDESKFFEILESPGLFVGDFIIDQIKELLQFKSPQKKFLPQELDQLAKQHLGSNQPEAYGVWVYFPWSNRLIHILDEEEFIQVRTSRNQLKITPDEQQKLSQKKIGVIGLSVGQSVSVTLAMERICGELRLTDFDLLELTNLNRIRTGVHNLGLPKVYSVAREIAEIDPFIKVVCYPEGLNEANMNDFFTKDGKLDLLVEESDGFDIKILSRYKARELKIPVIMEASDRCMVDVERFDLEPERPILHGLVDHLDITTLKNLKTTEEKIPYMLDILGIETSSPRLKASMLEIEQSINTWPQLASAVTMGGGIAADVSRRMLLHHFTDSGRYYVDVEEIIGNKSGKLIKKTKKQKKIKQPDLTVTDMKKLISKLKTNDKSDAGKQTLKKIVHAAIAAPSLGNSQPWSWLSQKNKLFLFIKRNYSESVSTKLFFNEYLAAGAAIENATIKAAELGYHAKIDYFPFGVSSNLIAKFTFKNAPEIKHQGALANYIFIRETNRKRGLGSEIENKVLNEIRDSISDVKGASLNFLTDKNKITTIANALSVCERINLLNPVMHSEYLNKEVIRETRILGKVGIDFRTLEEPNSVFMAHKILSDKKVASFLNECGKGKLFENLAYNKISNSSAIGLITMPSHSKMDLINGGIAFEKAWLSATKNNLAFQPICLYLYLIKFLEEGEKDKLFSQEDISDLQKVKEQVSLVFSELDLKRGVFLFRLFDAERPNTRSLRKPMKEVFFES